MLGKIPRCAPRPRSNVHAQSPPLRPSAQPDALAPRSRDTLNNLIVKSPQDWQTGVGLPFFAITGTVVEWDEIRFDVRLMQRVPYEGVSRMQTSLRRKFRDRVVRRGLGLVIESDVRSSLPSPSLLGTALTRARCCDSVLRHRGGSRALRQPIEEHSVLCPRDMQLYADADTHSPKATFSPVLGCLCSRRALRVPDVRQL